MRISACLGVLLLLFISAFVCICNADIVYLKNGRNIQGIIRNESADDIRLDIGLGMVGIRNVEIEHIERSSAQENDVLRKKWDQDKQSRQVSQSQEISNQNSQPAVVPAPSLKRPKEIDVTQESGHIFVEAVLNNQVKAELLVDTGASIIVLSYAMADKLGINMSNLKKRDIVPLQMGDGRKVDARFVTLKTVSVQGVEAKNVEAAILPESSVSVSFKDGLMGMSFLKKFNFKIDQNNKKLILEPLK